MTLTIKQQLRLQAKSVEFRFPLSIEKAALKLVPGLGSDPWLPGERELGVIFTHIPKSAGTSIVDSLFGLKSRHAPILRYAAYDEQKFSDSFKFTFVRNPWSRIHSAYHYLHRAVGKGDKFVDWTWATHYLSDVPTFEDFVLRLRDPRYRREIKRYVHFRDQMDWISIFGKGGLWILSAVTNRWKWIFSTFVSGWAAGTYRSLSCGLVLAKITAKPLRRKWLISLLNCTSEISVPWATTPDFFD